jgi:quercetin dioxygenase-like cupin family protein
VLGKTLHGLGDREELPRRYFFVREDCSLERTRERRMIMTRQKKLLTLVLTILCVAAIGSWALSAIAKQGSDIGNHDRVAMSHSLPRMDGDHLEAKAVEVTYQPGGYSGPHTHGCPLLAYVVEGAIRSQVNAEPERIYKAGETFYEAPNGVHRVSANASQTEPAKVIAFFVCDHATPITVPVPPGEQTNPK